MAGSRKEDDLIDLFDRALRGDANAEELQRLESLLDVDQQARDLYVEYSRFGVDLRYGFRTGALLGNGRAPRAVQLPKEPEGQSGRWRRRAAMGVLAAVAAGVAMAVLLRGDGQQVAESTGRTLSRPPAPVATLADHTNALWQGDQLRIGESLREGSRVTLLRGAARISVGAGAEIVASAPCELEFDAPDRVRLRRGEVAVNVAEWAAGFTILTDAMSVEDMGTTFTVSASRESGVRTKVLKGQVRAIPSRGVGAGPDGVLLTRGEAFSVDRDGRLMGRSREAIGEDEAFDFGALQPYRPVELFNTGANLRVGDEDPHWRIVRGPEGRFGGPGPAVLCEPDERYLPNDPASSQWVSVRDPQNAATNSLYTFQTTFNLDGYDVSTVQLFGRFLADNGIQEVRVNGAPVRVDSWIDNVSGQAFRQSEFRFVNVTDGLVAGANVVEIDVWNGSFQEPPSMRSSPVNPMALRVEWYAFGRNQGGVKEAI